MVALVQIHTAHQIVRPRPVVATAPQHPLMEEAMAYPQCPLMEEAMAVLPRCPLMEEAMAALPQYPLRDHQHPAAATPLRIPHPRLPRRRPGPTSHRSSPAPAGKLHELHVIHALQSSSPFPLSSGSGVPTLMP